jgi:hypothetical protein
MKIILRMKKASSKPKVNEDDEGTEVALQGTDENIICYKCGKKGHKSYECPENKHISGKNHNGKSKRYNGKCHNCCKTGLKAVNCWEDEKNASKI